MKINATEIRVGMILEYKEDLWEVLKTQHVKPGKGGAFAQVEMKNLNNISKKEFTIKLGPVYRSMSTLSKKLKNKDKNLIGFVGAPWTLLVYIINKKSPKKSFGKSIFNTPNQSRLLQIIVKYLKIHIKNQVRSGANVIQIFDSWAGLLPSKYLAKYIYNPTAELVEFTKSLNVPCICFPRQINDYKSFLTFDKTKFKFVFKIINFKMSSIIVNIFYF